MIGSNILDILEGSSNVPNVNYLLYKYAFLTTKVYVNLFAVVKICIKINYLKDTTNFNK